jgi:hypothetical protein
MQNLGANNVGCEPPQPIIRGSERTLKPEYEMVGIASPQPNKNPLTQGVTGFLLLRHRTKRVFDPVLFKPL